MTTEARPVDQLLIEPPEQILHTLQQGGSQLSTRDLLLVAQIASANARHPQRVLQAGREAALAWAAVALKAYDHLAVVGSSRRRAERDAMWLRTGLITTHGHEPGHPVLDCDVVFDWFLGGRATPVEEVRATSGAREIPRRRVLELLELKGEITMLRQLSDCPRFHDPDIQPWFDLLPGLPA